MKSVKSFQKLYFWVENVALLPNPIISTLDSIGGDALNFQAISYTDSRNREKPMYVMDRDAFSILFFGFTGEKALGYRIDFVKAFNAWLQKIILSSHKI